MTKEFFILQDETEVDDGIEPTEETEGTEEEKTEEEPAAEETEEM